MKEKVCTCDSDSEYRTNPQKNNGFIDSKEQKILHVLSEGDKKFKDLKDKTGFHQETLSRILDRLEERLVIRKDKKYKPCCNGYELIKIMSKNRR